MFVKYSNTMNVSPQKIVDAKMDAFKRKREREWRMNRREDLPIEEDYDIESQCRKIRGLYE